jgi:hypothetical protein
MRCVADIGSAVLVFHPTTAGGGRGSADVTDLS